MNHTGNVYHRIRALREDNDYTQTKIANILNMKLDILEIEEGASLGAAMLAAVACGAFASVEEAAEKIVKTVDTIEPDAELAVKYEARYQQYKNIYPVCKPLFSRLL